MITGIDPAAAAPGLAALVLWTAGFVLTLRVPVLERAFGGLERLYRAHHLAGALAYLVALAHPLVAAWEAGRSGGWPAAAAVLTPSAASPAMLAGWGAIALLVAMMAATFRVSLAYRRWRTLHAIVIPAFGLAAWHGLALASAGARGVLLLTLAVSAAALIGRLALRRAWICARPHRVAGVGHPGPGLVALELRPRGAPLRWAPGQFVFAAFPSVPGGQGSAEPRPYTIAGGGPAGALRLVIRDVGPFTRRLQSLPVGAIARVQGPFGRFLAQRDPVRPQLWIAGGIGVTPFLAALEREVGAPVRADVDLVHVHRSGDASVLACLPPDASGSPAGLPAGLRVHPIAFDSPDPAALWAHVAACTGPVAGRQAFLCGPPAMVEGLVAELRRAGVRSRDIHTEKFDFR